MIKHNIFKFLVFILQFISTNLYTDVLFDFKNLKYLLENNKIKISCYKFFVLKLLLIILKTNLFKVVMKLI